MEKKSFWIKIKRILKFEMISHLIVPRFVCSRNTHFYLPFIHFIKVFHIRDGIHDGNFWNRKMKFK